VPSLQALHLELTRGSGSWLLACWSCSYAAVGVRIVWVSGKVQRSHGGRRSWAGVHGVVVILATTWCWCCSQSGFGGKDPWSSVQCDWRQGPVHFQVVASEEQERSSSLWRWMRRGPHALCVQVGCAGAVTGVSSFARLKSRDRRLCVRGSRLLTLWRRSLSGHLGSQRAVVRRGTAVASPAQSLGPSLWLLSQDEVV
jgi:hypothetical protein